MNKVIKQTWLAALRGGEYKQGRRRLRSRHDEYCCLGVLCNLMDPTGWIAEPMEDAEGVFYDYTYEHSYGLLPPAFTKKANIPVKQQYSLAYLNDRGDSFAAIADYIEENL